MTKNTKNIKKLKNFKIRVLVRELCQAGVTLYVPYAYRTTIFI